MGNLKDSIAAKEAAEKTTGKVKKNTVQKIAGKDQGKMISAKVNEAVYAQFTQINKAYGMSNNSAINMLISNYVLEKKDILED